MSLRSWESSLVTWLKVKTKQKIVCRVFLFINFSQIIIRFAATRAMRPSTTPPRVSSQNKSVSWLSQPIVLSSNSLVVRAAKHGSQNKVIFVLVYLKPIRLFIIIRSSIFWEPNGRKDIIFFWTLFPDRLDVIDRIEKDYILKTHSFTLKMLAGVRFIPLLNVAIDAGNQLYLDSVVHIFK